MADRCQSRSWYSWPTPIGTCLPARPYRRAHVSVRSGAQQGIYEYALKSLECGVLVANPAAEHHVLGAEIVVWQGTIMSISGRSV